MSESTQLAQTVQNTPNIDPREFFPDLKIADRCDQCGAQAFVQVLVGHRQFLDPADPAKGITTTKTGATFLNFCGHDYRKNEAKLSEAGYAVKDSRHLINEKPSPGNADIGGDTYTQ